MQPVDIPYIDATEDGPAALVRADFVRFQAIIDAGTAHYGRLAMNAGDHLSRRWLARQETPRAAEIAEIAAVAGRPGAWLLNLSYEWTCTTGAGPDPGGRSNRMLRTLDWPLNGLGRTVVVAKFQGLAGDYFNVTWPGFVGVATAMAPDRFSAALNQPPMRRWTRSCWLDWLINRNKLWRRQATPPTHLLRRMFDECRSYVEARRMLIETPLSIPAFFTLSGTEPEQSCLIEREEDGATVHDGPSACANHWIERAVPGRYRGIDSPGRRQQMLETRDGSPDGFDWVTPPILNETTRVAVVADAGRGYLAVRGYERDGLATRDFVKPATNR
ncbi:MAG: hypothetical protein O2944_06290 [Proteobacteria bacterium]|nr:hypothetical protein [Pseudomonadota bacterium]